MRRLIIVSATCLLLAACGPKPATFQIEAEGAESATLSLCGKDTPMKKAVNNIFTVDRPITCSGSGQIQLKYKGGMAGCEVNDVTRGMAAHWKYFAQNGQCGLDAIELKK